MDYLLNIYKQPKIQEFVEINLYENKINNYQIEELKKWKYNPVCALFIKRYVMFYVASKIDQDFKTIVASDLYELLIEVDSDWYKELKQWIDNNDFNQEFVERITIFEMQARFNKVVEDKTIDEMKKAVKTFNTNIMEFINNLLDYKERLIVRPLVGNDTFIVDVDYIKDDQVIISRTTDWKHPSQNKIKKVKLSCLVSKVFDKYNCKKASIKNILTPKEEGYSFMIDEVITDELVNMFNVEILNHKQTVANIKTEIKEERSKSKINIRKSIW